jgi:hypothetical protein
MMRKVLFALLALLSFAAFVPAGADQIPTQTGLLIIPHGSIVTSTFTIPAGIDGPVPATGVDFSFADGTGSTNGEFDDGDSGFINFTMPLTSLTINWEASNAPFSFWDSDNVAFSCNNPVPPQPLCPASGTFTYTGTAITSLTWTNFNGFSGIDSMSYTPVPEPPAIWLLLTALFLLGLSRWAQMSMRKLSAH